MEWLNIHVSFLDSPQFIGADPVCRATWLCLFRYCAGQENGGRIIGCREWGDRRWQQLARVTKQEIETACDLWHFDGADLVMASYPTEKELTILARREAGRIGGQAKTTSKKEAARAREIAKAQAKHKQTTSNQAQASTTEGEGEGERKEKGKEVKQDGVPPFVFESEVLIHLQTPEIKELWSAWLEIRKKKRFANTPRSLRQNAEILNGMSIAGATEAMKNAVSREWRGIFPPSKQPSQPSLTGADRNLAIGQKYHESDPMPEWK